MSVLCFSCLLENSLEITWEMGITVPQQIGMGMESSPQQREVEDVWGSVRTGVPLPGGVLGSSLPVSSSEDQVMIRKCTMG